MITKENYISQFTAFSHKDLQWSTCGVTCVAMIIQQLSNNRVVENGSLEEFLSKLVEMHKNSGPTVYRPYILNGKDSLITVGQQSKVKNIQPHDVIKDENQEYNPVFGLINGIDHRGIPQVMNDYGIKAETKLDYPFDELVADFKSGKYKYFLASIHSLRTRESHIVIIQNIGTDEKGEYIEFVDPGEKEFDLAVKRQDFDFFRYIFNSRGTAIY